MAEYAKLGNMSPPDGNKKRNLKRQAKGLGDIHGGSQPDGKAGINKRPKFDGPQMYMSQSQQQQMQQVGNYAEKPGMAKAGGRAGQTVGEMLYNEVGQMQQMGRPNQH